MVAASTLRGRLSDAQPSPLHVDRAPAGDLQGILSTRLTSVPSCTQAQTLARPLARRIHETRQSKSPLIPVMPALLRRAGWQVRTLALDALAGGNQALMAPTSSGYAFVVDPHPTPEQSRKLLRVAPKEARARVIDWRLAHELAHTLFYRKDRRRSRVFDAAEETFCDAFADAAASLTRR